MDDQHIEQRDLAARLQDSAITARTVRNIAEIECDHHFASGPLSDKLMREIMQTIVKTSSQPWVAAATGSGPSSMCLELMVRKRLSPLSGKLQGNIALTESLLGRGFVLTAAGTRLIMPTAIDVDELALAFESKDFHEATEPVREATAMAVAAKPEIDELLGGLRATAQADKSNIKKHDGPTRINVMPTHGSHARR